MLNMDGSGGNLVEFLRFTHTCTLSTLRQIMRGVGGRTEWGDEVGFAVFNKTCQVWKTKWLREGLKHYLWEHTVLYVKASAQIVKNTGEIWNNCAEDQSVQSDKDSHCPCSERKLEKEEDKENKADKEKTNKKRDRNRENSGQEKLVDWKSEDSYSNRKGKNEESKEGKRQRKGAGEAREGRRKLSTDTWASSCVLGERKLPESAWMKQQGEIFSSSFLVWVFTLPQFNLACNALASLFAWNPPPSPANLASPVLQYKNCVHSLGSQPAATCLEDSASA